MGISLGQLYHYPNLSPLNARQSRRQIILWLVNKPKDNLPPALSRIERREIGVVIKLPKGYTHGTLTQLKETLAKYPGEETIALEVFAGNQWQIVTTQTKTSITPDLEKELAGLL